MPTNNRTHENKRGYGPLQVFTCLRPLCETECLHAGNKQWFLVSTFKLSDIFRAPYTIIYVDIPLAIYLENRQPLGWRRFVK